MGPGSGESSGAIGRARLDVGPAQSEHRGHRAAHGQAADHHALAEPAGDVDGPVAPGGEIAPR